MARPEYTVHVPFAIKTLIQEAKTVQCFEKGLIKLHKNHKVPYHLLRTHALHQACSKDDANLVEYLLKNISDDARDALINSPLGSHSYTPLFRAAYAGSVKMLKYLISLKARIDYENYHNEDVVSCLDAGFAICCKETPANAIFIKERFQDCKDYLLKHKEYMKEISQKNETDTKACKAVYISKSAIRNQAASVIGQFWRKKCKEAKADADNSEFQVVSRKRGRKNSRKR